jgi:tRNA(Ile)-lysidine synthase
VENLRVPEHIALLDLDTLTEPLELRKWQEGDRFTPLGMTDQKKVSDFLIDEKVSLPEKKRQFVLTAGGEIVWVVGRRIDNRHKITSKTENVLRITKENY